MFRIAINPYLNPGEVIMVRVDARTVRTFDTGATRDLEAGKLDYEGFLSPLVLERFAEYMNIHRVQSNGELRDSCNWQKGMPVTVYIKSAWRHFMDVWKLHRGLTTIDIKSGKPVLIEDALCALLFNIQGYLFELIQERLKGNEEQRTGNSNH